MAVQMSVPMSMSSTWATVRACGRPKSSPKVGATCGTLEQSVYMMDFCRFSEERRPCSMPSMMEAKLSSFRMMSAASWATSVPRMPMAMPTSASLSAGASLTPSPVIAVMWPPSCWKARTMERLCIGETRAKTQVCFTQFLQKIWHFSVELAVRASWVKLSSWGSCSSSCAPVITRKARASSSNSVAGMTPMRRAMASAVHGWSPVTMMVLAPASAIFHTASVAPGFGGSSRATRPRKVKPSMGKLTSSGDEPSNLKPAARSRRLSARHSTRLPCRMRHPRLSSAAARSAGLASHMARTRSGAPFSTARKLPEASSLVMGVPSPVAACTVSIHLLALLKGISKTCAWDARTTPASLSVRTPWQPWTIATSVGEPMSSPVARSTRAVVFSTPMLARRRSGSEASSLRRPRAGTSRSPALPAEQSGSCATAKSVSVIFPEVRVPVLSLQRMLTHPRVSTASILRTRTWRLAIFWEAIIRHTVTVGSSPSGTCAKKAVAAFSRTSARLRFRGDAMFATSERHPTATATKAMMCTKCSIWISREERVREVRIFAAISPITVLSPVPKTTQMKRPCTMTVPEKATLRDSTSCWAAGATSVERASGMDSPVSAEFSTSAPSVQARILTSAGMRWPASSMMTSPGRRSSGGISTSSVSPPLMR
mmetsp:Transcript_27263/g.81197  ORF Transcript_27263/g.81197 Transcript_27263/m.81197 type:complete len:656 (+) Transcript_27263:717-2684(+)